MIPQKIKTYKEFSQEKLDKLRLITALEKPSEVEIIKYVDKVEGKVLARVSELDNKIEEKVKEVQDSFPTFEEVVDAIPLPQDGYTPQKGIDYDDGKNGENYTLTDQDKIEIATYIEVPIVEKVIETVIREIPIVTNEIREVAIAKNPEVLRDKLESLEGDERIDVSAIKGLETVVRQPNLDRAISILDKRTEYLINKAASASSTSIPSGNQIWNETVSFTGFTGTLANTPVTGTVRLCRGGARQQPGVGNDYTVSGSVITLSEAAQTGEVFIADYSK